ncbi:MAG: FecR domain-containing protein [Pseudomonadota bacterium]
MGIDANLEDEADRWVVRRQSGEITPEEVTELKAWLAKPGAEAAYQQAFAALGALDHEAVGALTSLYTDELEGLVAAPEEEQNGPPRSRPYLAAASIAAGVCAVGIVLMLQAPASTAETYRTAQGVTETISLDDGSRLTLNSASHVEVEYSKSRREVTLIEGEAFFSVVHNAERQFVVGTPNGEVIVTGTTFNVDVTGNETDVCVVSGSVRVASRAANPLTLMSGQSVTIDEGQRLSDVRGFDPNTVLAWRDGKARFIETPLSAAIEDLNRYFSVPIVLESDDLGTLPLTGEFSTRNQDATLDALSLAFSLERRMEGETIVLFLDAPNPSMATDPQE